MQGGIRILVAVWALAVGASGYPSTISNNGVPRLPSCHRRLSNNPPRLSNYRRPSTTLASEGEGQGDEGEDDDDEEEGGVMAEFFVVSPVQIAFLRKESTKRESNRKLPIYTLPPEEHAMKIAPEMINDICEIFDGHELVEIRGVSGDDKKRVYYTAYALANTLEDAMERSVVVVDIRG